MRTDYHDQTRLCKGRPCPVSRFFVCPINVTLSPGLPPPLPAPIALSFDDLPSSSTFKSANPPTGKLTKLTAKLLRYLKRAQKMPILTRSVSATLPNRPYLTPPPTNPRAFTDDMTPLPSLFDKMIEAAKRGKRSTSFQLKSKVDDDPFALPSIPEAPEEPSSDQAKVCAVRQPSDTPIKVEVEPATHQPSATSDRMDFEDTPIVFSEPVYPNPPPIPIVPPPAPAPSSLLVCGEVVTSFPPSNPFDTYPGPPVVP